MSEYKFKAGDRVAPVDSEQWVPGLEGKVKIPGHGTVAFLTKVDVYVQFDSGDSWFIKFDQLQPESPVFATGDLVELKSGGPRMTVTSVKGDMVDVVYTQYGGDGLMNYSGPRIIERSFPLAVLKKAEPK